MTVAFAARAFASSFFIAGKVAMQRGRLPQFCFMKSSISSAVVFTSAVTGLSTGAGGALMAAHSSTTLAACAGTAPNAMTTAKATNRLRFMKVFLRNCRTDRPACNHHDAQAMRALSKPYRVLLLAETPLPGAILPPRWPLTHD